MYSYEKRFADSQGNYEIWQIRPGLQRKVAEDHHGFLEWTSKGNVPQEIPYTPPPAPDPAEVAKADLAGTDPGMIRVVEDLYEILVKKGIILASDLPAAAVNKIEQRKQLRKLLSEKG